MEHVANLLFIGTFSLGGFIISFALTPLFTKFLYRHRLGKQIREVNLDGRKNKIMSLLHQKKSGTPTMAGILIWGSATLLCFLSAFTPWSFLDRGQTYLPLFTLIATGLLGLVDDYLNTIGHGHYKGIAAQPKMLWLLGFASAGAYWFFGKLGWSTIHIPRLGDFDIGWWYIPLFILVIISTANAVNLTDGLDGLAAGLLIFAFGGFGLISYFHGLTYLTVFCGTICGALLSFLWFNIPPARFFMGDTGALSLGATLGVIAMLTNSVAVLPIIGFVFVIETASVLLQLWSKKFRGRRIFRSAPFHHHLEAIGWSEPKIVMRLWIIGAVTTAAGVVIGIIGMGNI